MDLDGAYFGTIEDIKWNAVAYLWKFSKGAFRHGRVDGANAYTCKFPTLKVIR
jgi:hypothetical protein